MNKPIVLDLHYISLNTCTGDLSTTLLTPQQPTNPTSKPPDRGITAHKMKFGR